MLPDPKNKAKDLRFCTVQTFPTKVLAKEHSALLALLHLQVPAGARAPHSHRVGLGPRGWGWGRGWWGRVGHPPCPHPCDVAGHFRHACLLDLFLCGL